MLKMKYILLISLTIAYAYKPGVNLNPSKHNAVADLLSHTAIPPPLNLDTSNTAPELSSSISTLSKTNTVMGTQVLAAFDDVLTLDPRTVRISTTTPPNHLNPSISLNSSALQNFRLTSAFFQIPNFPEQNLPTYDFADYDKYFRQFQRRHHSHQTRAISTIETNVTATNSSYTLRHLGTLLSSVGYAHVSFIINITEIYQTLGAVCDCSEGLRKLQNLHGGNMKMQTILAQHQLILQIGCERVLQRIDHIRQTFHVTETGIPTNLRRHKRQIIIAAALLTASLTGLFTASTLFKVATDGSKAQENQDFIVETLARNALRLNRTINEVLLTERTLILLEHHLQARERIQEVDALITMCSNELHSIGGHVDRLTVGLQSLLANKIHADLVAPEALEETSIQLRHRLEKIGYAPVSAKAADLYQSDASFISANGIIIGFIHLPIHKVELNLDLFYFVNVPVTSENHPTHYYLVKPERRYLAINHEMEVFREFNDADFANCKRAESTYYCPLDNVLHRYPKTTCLTAIYRSLNLSKHCTIELLKAQDHLTQTSDVTFRLLQPVTKRIEITCPPATKKKSLSVQRSGLMDVVVPYGCQAKTDSFIFTPQVTAEASINATHFRAMSFEALLGGNYTQALHQVFAELHGNRTAPLTLEEVKAKIVAAMPHPIIRHLPYLNSGAVLLNLLVTALVVLIIGYLCVKKRTYRGYMAPTGANINLTVNEVSPATAPNEN